MPKAIIHYMTSSQMILTDESIGKYYDTIDHLMCNKKNGHNSIWPSDVTCKVCLTLMKDI